MISPTQKRLPIQAGQKPLIILKPTELIEPDEPALDQGTFSKGLSQLGPIQSKKP